MGDRVVLSDSLVMWDRVSLGGKWYPDSPRWPSYSGIAPPGLQGVLVLFVWIGALDRVRRIESMTSAEQTEARRGLAQWLWLNGVRGEACWTWGQG